MYVKTKKWKEEKFLRYFLRKEKFFFMNFNIATYKSDDFNFYMGWFKNAINDYINKSYDIEEFFTYMFFNNCTLNIIYLPYILSESFRKIVIDDINEYKQKYNIEQIFE